MKTMKHYTKKDAAAIVEKQIKAENAVEFYEQARAVEPVIRNAYNWYKQKLCDYQSAVNLLEACHKYDDDGSADCLAFMNSLARKNGAQEKDLFKEVWRWLQ